MGCVLSPRTCEKPELANNISSRCWRGATMAKENFFSLAFSCFVIVECCGTHFLCKPDVLACKKRLLRHSQREREFKSWGKRLLTGWRVCVCWAATRPDYPPTHPPPNHTYKRTHTHRTRAARTHDEWATHSSSREHATKLIIHEPPAECTHSAPPPPLGGWTRNRGGRARKFNKPAQVITLGLFAPIRPNLHSVTTPVDKLWPQNMQAGG